MMQAGSWWRFCYDRTIIAFRRDDVRWLNTMLAVGLVSINFVAFGAAYWLATRDIMGEFTGEVRGGSAGPRLRGVRDVDRAGSLKQSSLSKRIQLLPAEEPSNVSLPLPPPRLNPEKPSGPAVTSTAPVSSRLAEAPSASPNTAPLAEHESPPAPAREVTADVETGPDAQSP
jgi:hypothetical protein